MFVTILRGCIAGGKRRVAAEVVQVDAAAGRQLTRMGRARESDPGEVMAETDKINETAQAEERAKLEAEEAQDSAKPAPGEGPVVGGSTKRALENAGQKRGRGRRKGK